MYSRSTLARRWPLLGATIACTLSAGLAPAAEHRFLAASQVDTAGLHSNNPADMQTLYSRLQQAAREVCSPQYRVGLKPVASPKACYEKALGNAVRDAKLSLLTQAYLTDHTLPDAAAHGLEVQAQMASR